MTKSIIRSLTLKEISAVDRPAQVGAKMTIMKRGDPPNGAGQGGQDTGAESALFHAGVSAIAKSMMEGGAETFADVYREQVTNREMWPMVDALQTSISSILNADDLSDADRQSKVEASVSEFLSAVRSKLPASENEVAKALLAAAGGAGSNPVTKGAKSMTDKPTIESLQKSLDEMKKRAETFEAIAKMSDAEKAHMKDMSEDEKKAFMALSDDDRAKAVKKSAEGDETVEYGGETISKRADPRSFAIAKAAKAEMEDLRKRADAAADEAQMERLTKRADAELGNLPGETIAKAKVLKAVAGMGEEDRATLDAMLKAGNSTLAKAFELSGTRQGSAGDTDIRKRREDALSEIMKRDNCTKSKAMETLASEQPELVNAA
ncbi:hypothetical protein DYI37_03155 [Fulvimarina endophytica]|uniref:Uncharacterized protein n=1 Tax=Fulvimarina endophytica TaxID=2293836 RepID=A0A371XB33_9HYPH|nr:hypothetical protein [Fulvimarina endophytica]RFC66456.1 hypothetical protein DYI37_03155 [Fulvimarina endophytica]